MKKIIFTVITVMVFVCTPLFMSNVIADTPGPPDPGDPGGDPVGGGAALGGGLLVMTALGLGYGAKKVYDARKKLM